MRTSIIGIGLLCAGLVVGFLVGGKGMDKSQSAVQPTAVAMTVSVIRPERKRVADTVRVVGQTRSRDEVRVVSELPGLRVVRLEAEAGDYVREGQTLAVLDGRTFGIQSDELRSEMARTQGEYERARTLVASQLVSREFFKQKQSAYEVARAQYENARLNVQRTRVVAPATGRVYRRNASIGDLTDSTSALFEIAKDGVVELEAEAPEAVVARLRSGMRADIEIVGRAAPLQGEIRLILPSVDRVTRASSVRLHLNDSDGLPFGVFGEAMIDVAEEEGWSIPRSALQQDKIGMFVWRVDEKGIVRRLPVTPKMQTTDTVIVVEEIGGFAIVAKAGPFVRENDHVRIASSGD